MGIKAGTKISVKPAKAKIDIKPKVQVGLSKPLLKGKAKINKAGKVNLKKNSKKSSGLKIKIDGKKSIAPKVNAKKNLKIKIKGKKSIKPKLKAKKALKIKINGKKSISPKLKA